MAPYKNDGPYGVVRYGRAEMTQHEHRLADGEDPVQPGMLVERTSENGEIVVQPHSTAGTTDGAYVVIEARGRGMNAHDGEYAHAADNFVRYVAASGGGLNLRLSAGEDVDVGAVLTSDGSGYAAAVGVDETGKFEAAAAVENTGDAGDAFVPTEVN